MVWVGGKETSLDEAPVLAFPLLLPFDHFNNLLELQKIRKGREVTAETNLSFTVVVKVKTAD